MAPDEDRDGMRLLVEEVRQQVLEAEYEGGASGEQGERTEGRLGYRRSSQASWSSVSFSGRALRHG
jgi:hypothetical protein